MNEELQQSLNSQAQMACLSNDIESLKTVHRKGANIDYDNGVCLRTACARGYLNIVQYLIQNNAKLISGEPDILDICSLFAKFDIIEYIVKHTKEEIIIKNNVLKCILMHQDSLPTIEYLVNNRAIDIENVISFLPTAIPIREWAIDYKNKQELNNKLEQNLILSKDENKKVKI